MLTFLTATPLSGWDVIKNSVTEGFSLAAQNLTLPGIIITLLMSFALGFFVYFVYKTTYRGVLYNNSFNMSLIMLTMVTSLVIMVISSSLALSLGMVGALSIVRFRTAVKDPTDTIYMFWAITTGITVGARFYTHAVIACLVIGLCIFLLTLFGKGIGQSYILVVHYDQMADQAVLSTIKRIQKRKIRSKTITRSGVELTVEVRLSDGRTGVIDALNQIGGVHDATLVSYQGDVG